MPLLRLHKLVLELPIYCAIKCNLELFVEDQPQRFAVQAQLFLEALIPALYWVESLN